MGFTYVMYSRHVSEVVAGVWRSGSVMGCGWIAPPSLCSGRSVAARVGVGEVVDRLPKLVLLYPFSEEVGWILDVRDVRDRDLPRFDALLDNLVSA